MEIPLKDHKFRYLDHTADVFVEAYGSSLETAFENAALAMFEIMTDTEMVAFKAEEAFEVEGRDESALLYNWLEALLVRFEVSNMLYSKFKIAQISEIPEGFRLKATVQGEKLDPQRHSEKTGVKAVTYHEMEVQRNPNEVRVKFLLDI
jgi:SHS2 domain-containing protein